MEKSIKKSEKPIILESQDNPNIDLVLKLIKTDRYKARVLVKNAPDSYRRSEIVLFINPDDSFTIINKSSKMSMSSNSRIYFTDTNKSVCMYTKGKFWYSSKTGKRAIFKPLLYQDLQGHKIIIEYFKSKFPWIQTIEDDKKYVCHSIPFNTIVKYNLTGLNDMIKYKYKTNITIAKLLYEYNFDLRNWKKYKNYLINLDSLDGVLLGGKPAYGVTHTFIDSLRLAEILDKRVNCKWGEKRLKEEHDQWAKEITSIQMEASNRPMKIANVYLEFSKFSGYKLIETTKDLAIEGMTQSHCVASYVSSIDSGSCAIAHIDGFTAEFRIHNGNGRVMLSQFRGLRNEKAPDELENRVQDKIVEFNLIRNKDKVQEPVYEITGNRLPF